MASAAHVYGRPILGAESFTATDREKWQGHPANLKALGDGRSVKASTVSCSTATPCSPGPTVRPGHDHGTLGPALRTHPDLVGTVAGVARVPGAVPVSCSSKGCSSPTSASSPRKARRAVQVASEIRRRAAGLQLRRLPGEVLLTRMSVKDGRLVLPDGMSYRMLVLPRVETMTPRLLAKIRDLVRPV